MTFTSALLLAAAPPPLAEGFNSLSASGRSDFLDVVLKTSKKLQPNHWKYIYIHQSGSPTGDANSLSVPGAGLCDHFVIGNGQGTPRMVRFRSGRGWNEQQAPAAPPGVDSIEPECISVCMVGDFDVTIPTPSQLHRLSQLVGTLQNELHIGADRVIMLNQSTGPSSVGRYFPVTAFRDQILP